MTRGRGRRFGALIDPTQVYVIEYRRDSAGVEIMDHMSVVRGMPAIEDAAGAVADLVRSVAAPGDARVTAAIRGFGISYELLTLPPAGSDVLQPVVDREMRRLFPDIDDPLISFAVGGNIDRRTGKRASSVKGVPDRRASPATGEILPLEILAAAAPRRVVNAVAETLSRAGIRLEHLTVVPQAMARLYREVSGSQEPAGLVIMLRGSPVIGVFQGGDIRFISEPPPADEAPPSVDLQTVIDQVGRARMYLRQHFRGVDVDKILVAADPADQAHVDAVLNAALNLDVLPLAPTMGPPAAIVALGGVLNAEGDAEMVLYPPPEQLHAIAGRKRTTRANAMATAVCVLALVLAVFSTISVSRAAGTLRAARALAEQEMARTAAAMQVIENRRQNFQRTETLRAHAADRQHLAEILNALRLAQPPNVGLSAAALARTSDGWTADISGSAAGSTGAQVVRGVDEFYRDIQQRLPLQSVSLDAFDQAGDEPDVTGTFKVTFRTRRTPTP